MEAEHSAREHEPATQHQRVQGGVALGSDLHVETTAVRGRARRRQRSLLSIVGRLRVLGVRHRVYGGSPSRMPQVLAAAVGMLLSGCPGAERETPASASPASQVGSLSFDLPAGVSVSVDGQDRGVTPIPALEVSASSHRVVLKTACGEVEQTIAIQPDAETTIDRAAVSGLAFTTVHVEAKTIRDKPLEVKLHLGEAEVPGEDGRFEIPACPARMRIEPTGTMAYNLGSFIEDVEPKGAQTLTRTLVLRPGPDVVRLHGGAFRQGPHPSDDSEQPRTPLWPKRVNVEAFDMDKTEVTARQYMECLGEGMCEKDPGQVLHTDSCVFQLSGLSGADARQFGRRILEGKEDLPANCVNIIEAKSYCEWRGMRLPTPLEFDYAYRSTKSEYAFPWGNDESECRAFGGWQEACSSHWKSPSRYEGEPWGYDHARPSCSFEGGKGTSEQGICDLAGNRREFALFEADLPDEKHHYLLGGEHWRITGEIASGSLPGDPSIGFRCVQAAGKNREAP